LLPLLLSNPRYCYQYHPINRCCCFAKGIHLGHTPALDCAGMIVPGAIVYCTHSTNSDTKTKYKVQFCEEERENGTQATVACHPFLAEKVAKELLKENHLSEELGVYNGENVLGQQTFGQSRVDFVIQHDDNSITLVEVKNVVGADYFEGAVPVARYDDV
jgi:DNA-binding sugar fermentation-stimulating protein